MNFLKTIDLKKITILFVAFVFVLQPAFVLAEVVDGVVESESTEISTEEESPPVVLVETGDVVVEVELDNEVNQNILDNVEDEEPLLEATEEDVNPAETSDEVQDEETDEQVQDEEEVLQTPETGTARSGDDILENSNEFEGKNIVEADGVSGDNVIASSGAEAIIDTGDIYVEASLENDINGNDLNILCVDCEEEDASSSVFDIENQNDSSLDNELGISATSGDNFIDENNGALIETGNIGIVNMIINFVNTNFIGSGKEFFINIFNKMNGSIDLSGYGDESDLEKTYDPCDGPECQINIDNNSTSSINNLIDINATTGSNIIATTTGGGVIETGDIDIVNDILNIANLNVSGNDYFFAVVNIFGEMDGDVVLPAAKQIEENIATSVSEKVFESEVSSEFVISNQNNAGLSNDLNINANSGDNTMAGDGDSFIMTGDIESQIKTLNLINYNISGDSWKFARINVFGSWEGIINGLPEEYSYYEDADGITVYNKFLDDLALNEAYAQLAIDNYNIASTTNEININASTGDNSILHHEESSLIKTGYIKIKNSLLNFLNSNFSGNNWEFSMINVFGDWKGNLDFGQPDLWLSVSSSEDDVLENDYITYTFLYGNNGDASAKNVILADDFEDNYLEIVESGGGEEEDGFLRWSLGDIPPNSQGSFSYTVQASNVPSGRHLSENVSRIMSEQGERDFSNNEGRVLVYVSDNTEGYHVSAVSSSKSNLPSLSILKTNDASDVVYPGDIINFELLIRNNGSRDALEVYVLDVMSNLDTGIEIHRDFWDLGTVYAGEEVLIEYSLEVSVDIESGTYINEATIEGFDSNRQMYVSAIGSSRNKIINNVEPEEDLEPAVVISRVTRSTYANPGDLIDFEIIVANNGRGEALGIEITEILPDYLTYSDTGNSIGSWKFDIITSGEIKNIKYSIAVSEKATEGFYESYISLVGDNIDSEFLTSSIEVREVVVLGMVQEDQNFEREREENETVATVSSEPNLPFIRLRGIKEKITEEPVLDVGQVLGISEEQVSSFPMYRIYLFIVFLIVLLILILFLFFMEGKDDREKLV